MTTDVSFGLTSLPPALYRKISDFCEAQDILSLSSTCRTVHRELGISVLSPAYELFYSQHYSASPLRQALQIPIFFAQQCHSVQLTCHWSDPGAPERPARLYILARPKTALAPVVPQQGMPEGLNHTCILRDDQILSTMIVWESTPPKKSSYALEMNITIRHNPQYDYFLWYQCPLYLLIEHFQVHRLLVWEEEAGEEENNNAYRRATYAKCMELESLGQDELFSTRVEPHDTFSSTQDFQSPTFPFLAQLFDLAVTTLKEDDGDEKDDIKQQQQQQQHPSSNLQTLFESMGMTQHVRTLQTFSHLYQQLVEQKEPQYCTTLLPLSPTSSPNDSSSHIVTLPWIPLKTEFGWVPKEDLKEIPRFVARIPLLPNTKSFSFKAQRGMYCHGRCTFFLFASIHPECWNGSEDWVFNNTQHCHRHLYAMADAASELDVTFDVDPTAQAYFLYVMPDKSTMEELSGLQVQLKVLVEKEDPKDCSLNQVMQRFLGPPLGCCTLESSNTEFSSFPLQLLQAAARTLLECQEQSCEALATFLQSQGFSTSPQGLSCIVELIDSIIQQRKMKSLPVVVNLPDNDQNFRAM